MAARQRKSHDLEHPLASKAVTLSATTEGTRAGIRKRKSRSGSPRWSESGEREPLLHAYPMVGRRSLFHRHAPEFDDAKTHGDTYEEAVRMGKELIESFFIWYEQDGKSLPRHRMFVDTAA
jgi:predicted RNase H-like HicB family nuclease